MTQQQHVEINMMRESLRDLPQFPLPQPYSIRWWREGDLGTWLAIQRETDELQDVTKKVFRFYYGDNETEFGRRICFLCDSAGREIGTVSAWYEEDYFGENYGRIHWLAIVPSMQRRGLSRPLIAIAFNRMAELGHRKAYLTTESERHVAVRLYLEFGFVPDIISEQQRAEWVKMKERGVPVAEVYDRAAATYTRL